MRARLVAWLCLYPLLTFCCTVLIEHGPENFWTGAKIEFENLQSFFAGQIKLNAPAASP
ncbi:MAG: hypothetical protein JO069_17235 [Verrucomicrobia bacterium]|nr:hypothetical protein [Verrucomicrobiota bacterium]